MNHEIEQSTNVMAKRVAWNGVVVPPLAERIQGWFHRAAQEQSNRELNLRLEERRKERARIARDLHDTLFQGFLGASMVLQTAVEGMPADSPSKPLLSRALSLMRRVIDEGRQTVQGLRSFEGTSGSLEQALAGLGNELIVDGVPLQISVTGHPKALNPPIQEQVYLIAREALVNALRHAEATRIEVEIEYLPSKLRVVVRDNGTGMDPEVLRSGRDSHWGLLGMRERARNIGAKLEIWTREGAGTEVEISVPEHPAVKT
jgi:signal transduction histidine kinase